MTMSSRSETGEETGAAMQAALEAALQQLQALSVKVQGLELRLAEVQAGQQQPRPLQQQGGSSMPFLQHHTQLSGLRLAGLNGPSAGVPTAAGLLQNGSGAQPPLEPRPPSQELPTPMASTRVVMTQLVSLADSNGLDVCMGGAVLSWIDICAGLAAKSLARGPAVTASVDAVHFLRPCHVNSIVILAAMVNRTFNSSMEVGVRVEEEDARTGARHHCCSAYLTFVALSRKGPEDGPPQRKQLPKVAPSSPYFRQIHADAAGRREARLAARQRLRSSPQLEAQEAECRLQPITHRAGGPTLPPALRVDVIAEGRKRRLRPSLTAAHMTQMILPQHANSIGITFGGQAMRWMEQCAFISAARVCRGGHLLTASMDSIAFSSPTRVGDILYIEAQVTAVFGSSVEVMISVWGETPDIGTMFHCGDAYATIVSVDGSKSPVDIPFELVPESGAEKLRHAAALQRRGERLAMRDALRRHRAGRLSLDGEPQSESCDEMSAALDQSLYSLGGPQGLHQTGAHA